MGAAMITTSTGPTAASASVGVQIHAVDGRRIQYDSGIDGRDQFDKALIGKPSDPLGVDLPIPADAD
jgi:hypothetical protein